MSCVLSEVKIILIEARLCRTCGPGFNSQKLSDEDLNFIYKNYLYISPLKDIGSSKYEGMIAALRNYSRPDDKIVEIGCSEGYLLKKLRDAGYTRLTGIEPGPQAICAENMGLSIIREFFTKMTFLTLDIDTFLLMHVFEHFEDPFSILDAMIANLAPGGEILIEVPDFDGFHHQHLFFYNVPFFVRLAHDKKLNLVEIIKESGSLRVIFIRQSDTRYSAAFTAETPEKVNRRALSIQSQFQSHIGEVEAILQQNAGKTLYWWGAGSASTIWLNQMDKNLLDQVQIIVGYGDANKTGSYIPGVYLTINSLDSIKGTSVDTLIIASSFFREITEVIRKNSITVKTIKVLF